jgi:hypothetical protein
MIAEVAYDEELAHRIRELSPDVAQRLLARPHARPMEMRGRKMNNWIRVDEEGIATKRQLGAWVRRGVQLARSLPPKG